MDAYTLNKYAGGLIAAILIVFLLGKLGNIAIHPKKLEKQVYSESALVNQENKVSASSNEPKEVIPLPVLLANASVEKGQKASKKCASCHNFTKGGKIKLVQIFIILLELQWLE